MTHLTLSLCVQLTQVIKVVNYHMASFQWIEDKTQQIQSSIQSVSQALQKRDNLRSF